ncbi:MAG: peptidoglycan-binding protein, partial [Clostridia bacterium]|nr:peptidoglycan-binding protein [Clostridia bacterium]
PTLEPTSEQVWMRLMELGYVMQDSEYSDESYIAALTNFQIDMNLEPTGFADEETLMYLFYE